MSKEDEVKHDCALEDHSWDQDPELSGDKFVERCAVCGLIRSTSWN